MRYIPIHDGVRGAALVAEVYVNPTDVSFKGVSIGERTADPEWSGSLKDPLDPDQGRHTAWSAPAGSGNLSTGCYVTDDNAGFEMNYNRPGDGIWIWDIPWFYQVGTYESKVFTTIRQDMRNIGDKKSTVSKNGITVERTIP